MLDEMNRKPVLSIKELSHSDWESVSLANNSRCRELVDESRLSYPDSPLDLEKSS